MSESLTEFLLARIAEDEEMADRSVQVGDKGAMLVTFRLGHLVGAPDSPPVMLIHPSRVLAECDAKRQIAEHCDFDHLALSPGDPYVLALLALPYADHPDYREEWKP